MVAPVALAVSGVRHIVTLTARIHTDHARNENRPMIIAPDASVVEPVTPGPPSVDGIVEELFPEAGMSDPHAFYGSDGDDAELQGRLSTLMASVTRIGADRDLDLVPTDDVVPDEEADAPTAAEDLAVHAREA